ncbi:MAG: hypothetical protein FJ119_01370 [Deltaproteobacteria bacterium]|nr:hypothetical protein [Deltaproteobacteria bacterium]
MSTFRAARKYIYVIELVLLVSLVTGSLVLVNYIASRHRVRFDLTPQQSFTLAPLTLRVLEGLREPLQITIFHKRDEKNEFQDLVDLLKRASGLLAFQFIDLDKNPARAASFDISNYGAAIVEYGGRRERVRYFTEEHLVTALIRLTEKNEKIVRFVTGHGEKSFDAPEPVNSFSQVRHALGLENYRVEPLLLMNASAVPEDTLILVVAGPQEDFLAHELELIERYIRQGGRVLMLFDSFPLPRVEEFLRERFAIDMPRDYIIDTRSTLTGFDMLTPVITPDKRHPIAAFMNKSVVFPYCRSILPRSHHDAGMTQTVLAVSGPDSWAERNPHSVRDGVVRFDPAEDMAGPVPVAVLVETAPTQADVSGGCLLVAGNSNFASDHYINIVGNRDFFLNMVGWLAEQQDLLGSRGSSPAAPEMYFMTRRQGQLIYWLCVVVQPVLVLLCGALVVWWRRRRA